MSEVPDSPQTRTETYLAGALGQPVVLPEPVTRLEQYLKAIAESGGGGGGLMPVIIYAESHTIVETYTVPVLTDTQITAAYNGIMAGKVVVVIDDTDTLAMQVFDASNDDETAIRLIFTDKMILNYKEGGEIEPTLLAGGTAYSADAFIANYNADDSNVTATKDDDGKLVLEAEGGTAPVQSVNNKTGIVVLNASDILAQNSQSIQSNLERIDDELAIRQVTVTIDAWPETLTDDFLYRIETTISHGGKTYEAGLYQVVNNDLAKIGEGGGGGLSKMLTTADYNYPTANPDGVAIWKLDAGIYYTPTTASGIKVYYRSGDYRANDNASTFMVGGDGAAIPVKKVAYRIQGGGDTNRVTQYKYSDLTTGAVSSEVELPIALRNNLTTTTTGYALDATQGKALSDLIYSFVFSGAGTPPTNYGSVGQLYEDTTNGKLYQCTAVSGSTRTWTEVGAGGGSGPNVVQTTGTSTTDVMSQKAVSETIFKVDSSGNLCKELIKIGQDAQLSNDYGVGQIAIGKGANTSASFGISIGTGKASASGNSSIAIIPSTYADTGASGASSIAMGANTKATAESSVAFGAHAIATTKGEMNIGTGNNAGQGSGYSGSDYRLLTGLYDGQSAHDAATVNQLNTLIDSINSALSANIPHIGNS